MSMADAPPAPKSPPGYRFTRAHAIAAAVLVGATLTVLASYGRRWWCACGSFVPWSTDINGQHNSQHFVDPYSVSHFEHGLFFFVFLLLFQSRLSLAWRLVCAAGIECAWELLENSSFIIDRYRAATVSSDYYGDSMINSLSDVIFASLGFVVASFLPKSRFWPIWIALVLVCELGLIFTVRDSLAINVIMLAHPVDAIRAWQAGG
jgi:hypothetical protein